MKKYLTCLCLLLILTIFGVHGNEQFCERKDNCIDCLAVDYNCAWCSDEYFSSPNRCYTKEILLEKNCSALKIIQNNEEFIEVKSEPTSDYESEGSYAKAIQLQPQKLKIKLVKSHTQQFKIRYRPAKDYPLDLYYLMDLTWSMKDDKETLAKIGEELSETLKTLSKNYRFGFGSFADKPAMPMIMPGAEENPCIIEHTKCEPTYSFKHHLALTKNISDFVNKVNSSQVTGNLDNLEGQLDALMQVIVCNKQIGWVEDAKKFVVLVTDGLMHFAGDGKLAGITKRNDKKCHLNENGEYKESLQYDYPSLEEMYRELLKRKFKVIFAVTENVSPAYKQISKLMTEISSVGILRSDSSNILELIKMQYQTLSQKFQFEDNSPDIISMKYFTDCGGVHSKLVEKNYCNNVELGNEIDFYINITLDKYPTDGNWSYNIRIETPGSPEAVEIDIEIQQPCPCTDAPIKTEIGRKLCNYHGYNHCGMCVCDEGWLGTVCSCDSGNYTTNKALENQCRQSISGYNNELGPICSDRGECDCGKCHCDWKFEGTYCECPICPVCDPEQQECHCGKCVCKYGWSKGDRCCPDAIEGCISPSDGSECSDQGKCDCNQCECNESYYGKFCEFNLVAQQNMLCSYYEECVTCLIHEEQGTRSENCLGNFKDTLCSSNDSVSFSYEFTAEILQNTADDLKCLVRLESKNGETKCDHYFTYETKKNGISHLKINRQECRAYISTVALGFIGFISTLLIGFLGILLWKFWIWRQDRIEFAKFEEEQKNRTSFNLTSPIYKNPVTHHSVPNLDEN